jgi:hypothetical protein
MNRFLNDILPLQHQHTFIIGTFLYLFSNIQLLTLFFCIAESGSGKTHLMKNIISHVQGK